MFFLSLALTLAAAPTPQAKEVQPPPACRTSNYQACADATAPGSPAHSWAMINLGTQAYLARNFAEAVRLYDAARMPGQTVSSDAHFHAFRGDAYRHVGRDKEALDDARMAWRLLSEDPTLPPETRGLYSVDDEPRGLILTLILPLLKMGNDPAFAPALAAFQRLPVTDWVGHSQRASVLKNLGDLDGALDHNAQALAGSPDHPGLLNNQCYYLTLADRGKEAIGFCQRAIEQMPDEAAFRHSYATALASIGSCDEAEAEMTTARRLDPSAVSYPEPLDCPAAD
tara:strand:- start:11 stop:862 length:852 start_codon:yes stop_codon:yes gene_type:complete